MQALIRRTFHYLDERIFLFLYKTLVRSHIDYANTVWTPHKVKEIERLEGVQRRATKQLPGFKELTYEERLKKLKLPTLRYRSIRGDMIETYKILSGNYNLFGEEFLNTWEGSINREGNRGNSKKLYTKRSRLDLRKHYFTNRITKPWNSLPNEVVQAETTNAFKNKLDKHWRNKRVLYDFKSEL